MDSHAAEASLFALPLVLLAALVISVPIARFARLSAIVAYLVAGVVIGPYGLGMFTRPETILTVAELGVVMLLFLIGLELELSRLLAMRRDIFGLGVAQLVLTAAAIAGLALATGLFGWRGALVAGLALALSATSIALRILEERGHLQQPYGQRAFAILLFQDMAVVPLLALLPLLAPGGAVKRAGRRSPKPRAPSARRSRHRGAGARRPLSAQSALPPARLDRAREVMTAAALLVVLGAALLMHAVGMSMALGAFLAGVLLAESSYRHELEADIEPFRGLLLALFFMGVGMTIDMKIVMANLWLIIAAALVITVLKAASSGRCSASPARSAVKRCRPAPCSPARANSRSCCCRLAPRSVSSAPCRAACSRRLPRHAAARPAVRGGDGSRWCAASRARDEREADDFDGTHGSVLVIGFGRFGQIVSQYLLAEEIDVTAIDLDPEMIQVAAGSASRSITATARGSTCCAPPALTRRG